MDLQRPLARRVQHQVTKQRLGEKNLIVPHSSVCSRSVHNGLGYTGSMAGILKFGDQGVVGSLGGMTTKIDILSIIFWTTTN